MMCEFKGKDTPDFAVNVRQNLESPLKAKAEK
jgi:hypothetical protein